MKRPTTDIDNSEMKPIITLIDAHLAGLGSMQDKYDFFTALLEHCNKTVEKYLADAVIDKALEGED